MKIVIKEMSADRDKLLIYLMTEDGVPVRCEMTTKQKSKTVINNLTKGIDDITTTTIKYPENILDDE